MKKIKAEREMGRKLEFADLVGADSRARTEYGFKTTTDINTTHVMAGFLVAVAALGGMTISQKRNKIK
jgi:hypothetical protein